VSRAGSFVRSGSRGHRKTILIGPCTMEEPVGCNGCSRQKTKRAASCGYGATAHDVLHFRAGIFRWPDRLFLHAASMGRVRHQCGQRRRAVGLAGFFRKCCRGSRDLNCRDHCLVRGPTTDQSPRAGRAARFRARGQTARNRARRGQICRRNSPYSNRTCRRGRHERYGAIARSGRRWLRNRILWVQPDMYNQGTPSPKRSSTRLWRSSRQQ